MSPLLGVGLAVGLAGVGRWLRWLTTGGAVAAAAVGAAVFVGGGRPGASWLALFFLSGSLLGDRPLDAGPPHRGRTWRQVVANGGWAAVGAILVMAGRDIGWPVIAGSLAAATADTWATELGTRFGRRPVMITTFAPVPIGTSGAVSVAGTMAGIAGAALLAVLAALTRPHPSVAVAAALGGVAGFMLDSLAGATVQGVYRCEQCARETEAPARHHGHRVTLVRGRRGIDNDVVNLLATSAGAFVATATYLLLHPPGR